MRTKGAALLGVMVGTAAVATACKDDKPPGPPAKSAATPSPIGGAFNPPPDPGGILNSPTPALPQAIVPGALDGTWQTPCQVDPSVPTRSGTQEWVISGTRFSYTYKQFSDTTCTLPDLTQKRSGTLVFGPASLAVPLAQAVNIMLSGESTQLQSEARAQAWNSSNFCQANNWRFAGTYDTLKCEPTVIIYDLWQLQGVQLLQGLNDAGHTGTSEATRPAALNPAVSFNRI